VAVEVPHFAYPFRLVGGAPAVNEQDSLDDVAACVSAALLTSPGDRDERPEYGVSDPTFSVLPMDPDALVAEVQTWEPRARILADEDPSGFAEAVERVRLTLTLEDPTHG
jgi:phage baseplate assembly protein W